MLWRFILEIVTINDLVFYFSFTLSTLFESIRDYEVVIMNDDLEGIC